jgi:hypothetical protein
MSEISIAETGSAAVILRLRDLDAPARTRLEAAMVSEGFELVRIIQEEKLSGQMVGQRTRRLRDSIHFELDDAGAELVGTVGTNVSYAKFVHDGTAPHVIEAKAARALHFFANGKEVFVKRVNHPGTKARPFATSTLQERRAILVERLTRAVMGDAV